MYEVVFQFNSHFPFSRRKSALMENIDAHFQFHHVKNGENTIVANGTRYTRSLHWIQCRKIRIIRRVHAQWKTSSKSFTPAAAGIIFLVNCLCTHQLIIKTAFEFDGFEKSNTH